MHIDNTAAWLSSRLASLSVGPAPYTPPAAGEILIRTRAIAVNPVDWIIQLAGNVLYPWLKVPCIIGEDVAGDVVEVGAGVTRFGVGDRVFGLAVGTDRDVNSAARGAFQSFVLLSAALASPLPDSMSFEDAAVIPLGVATAAAALFQRDHLGLRRPVIGPDPTGETVLIWGGSTSVGTNAIQLAVAAGYEVVTTASPANHPYLKALGAAQVFDYASPTVAQDIVDVFHGRSLAGALAIGEGSADRCIEIFSRCEGNRFISTTSTPVSFSSLGDPSRSALRLPALLFRIAAGTLAFRIRCRLKGIRTKAVFATSIKRNDVSTALFTDFLPRALAARTFTPAPPARIVGTGLDHLQKALDTQRSGVSAQKIVVTL